MSIRWANTNWIRDLFLDHTVKEQLQLEYYVMEPGKTIYCYKKINKTKGGIMDVDVKVLQEIAQDKARVADVDWWLKQDDSVGKQVCPISRMSGIGGVDCKSLCWKIWPDLVYSRPSSEHCPCNNDKPVREVFQAISALSKLVQAEEKFYQRGDIFRLNGTSGYGLMLVQIEAGIIMAVALEDGNRQNDVKVKVKDSTRIPEKVLSEIFHNAEYEYIGNIRNLSIVNGEVVKAEGTVLTDCIFNETRKG